MVKFGALNGLLPSLFSGLVNLGAPILPPSWFSAVDAKTIRAGAPNGFGIKVEPSIPGGNGWCAAGGDKKGLCQKLKRNIAKSCKFCIA
jgi:hypothetical protein